MVIEASISEIESSTNNHKFKLNMTSDDKKYETDAENDIFVKFAKSLSNEDFAKIINFKFNFNTGKSYILSVDQLFTYKPSFLKTKQ